METDKNGNKEGEEGVSANRGRFASAPCYVCLCSSWVREPEQTEGILTRHHPNCPAFEGKQKYFKITLHGGGSYIQPINELANAIDGETDGAEPGTKWTLELIEMYREQYEALPEFQGH